MDPIREAEWARRLRPLDLGDQPLAAQLRRRLGVVLTMTAILSGLISFFVAIFAAFARTDLGLAVSGVLLGPLLVWIWWDYAQLKRSLRLYVQEESASRAEQHAPD